MQLNNMFSNTKPERGKVMDIGNRIKQLRMKNGLTLEELADRCELSKGFLSQLERNISSPSISTLEDIIEVLGVNMAGFFKEETNEPSVFTNDDFYVKENEDSLITWLVPNAQKNEMEPILYELEPGSETFVVQPYEGEEFGYVLRGKITLVNTSKDEKIDIRKGETFYLKGNDEHYFINESERIAKFLWICTPPVF